MRLGAILVALGGLCAAAEIPAGTQVQIRLTSAINTANTKVNQSFEAVVIAPVVLGDQFAMAAGVKVTGHIKEVTAALKPDDQAVLSLAFDELRDSRGKRANLPARLAGVDNARESLDADGRILGIIASQTGSGRLDQGINKVAERNQGLADLLSAIKQSVVKETDANIDYEPGVEMTIELTKALSWTGVAAPPDVKSIEPQEQLTRLVQRQPFQTMAAKPPKPSDITNMMFLGSQQDIENAFQQAGWSTAEELSAKSKLETFRAMTEMRGYKEAPVSILYLEGRPPDLVFQKQNNTFNARHHLRIWHQPGSFRGQDVWVCSATHDTGIDYSEQNRTFIHKVDSEIDRERAKVVNDLLFTGLVRGLSLVERPAVPLDFSNATGDRLATDGRMAVVSF
ncbi:MAG TPA: LssY C-terminal domain-containing protein [Bryobacteraceae bacterium]|nr:LssY C-terminal domain-containing protein [Bryobacteraceae bacterium]